MSETERRTPLHGRHVDAGARMVPFAGWDMPVQYRSIVAEHKAVRASAGLFDVSHMGEVRMRGPRQALALRRTPLHEPRHRRPGVGRVRYGLLVARRMAVSSTTSLLYRRR